MVAINDPDVLRQFQATWLLHLTSTERHSTSLKQRRGRKIAALFHVSHIKPTHNPLYGKGLSPCRGIYWLEGSHLPGKPLGRLDHKWCHNGTQAKQDAGCTLYKGASWKPGRTDWSPAKGFALLSKTHILHDRPETTHGRAKKKRERPL